MILRGGRKCTGLCVRGVGVVLEVAGCRPFGRRVGTAVCVEVVDAEVTDGLGEGARSGFEEDGVLGATLGVAVRLEEVDGDGDEGLKETLGTRSCCLLRSIPVTYSERNLSTVRRSCFRKNKKRRHQN